MAQAQTEKVINRLSDGRKEIQCILTGVVLNAGVAAIVLNNLKEVTDFELSITTPAQKADTVFEYKIIKEVTSNFRNGLTLTAKMMACSAVNTWGNAATADIAATVFCIRAIGI